VGINDRIFFYDTYALYYITNGEENYKKYTKNHRIITSMMNLYELYYNLIKENDEMLGEFYFKKLEGYCVKIDAEDIKMAAKFRKENIKKKLSYIDCLGYIIAKSNGVKFLTGDKEFDGLENVEFVK